MNSLTKEQESEVVLLFQNKKSKESIAAFYRLIYKDAPFWLERKRKKFHEIFDELGVSH